MLEWVGPPIMDSFRDLAGFDLAESQRALDIYRDHYLGARRLTRPSTPGSWTCCAASPSAGIPLSLATSKPEGPPALVLDHFDLTAVFDEITGASDDETRSRKADVVAEACAGSRPTARTSRAPVMVGDRRHDIEGAAEHDVPTIYVTWGYGAPAEQAGAVAVVDDRRRAARSARPRRAAPPDLAGEALHRALEDARRRLRDRHDRAAQGRHRQPHDAPVSWRKSRVTRSHASS